MLSQDDVAKMSREERIKRLADAAGTLAGAIAGQSAAVLARRPDEKNWAPTEVICHLRDTEESFTLRFQSILGTDEPTFFPIEPDRWAEERQYLKNDPGLALEAFRKRREEALTLIRGISPPQWQRGGIHPTRGRMTAEDFLNLMVWHDDNHLHQLQRGLRGEA